ncbi:hypothetical protein PSPO01_10800 [Paraphaeosphaeria sporulosa]
MCSPEPETWEEEETELETVVLD